MLLPTRVVEKSNTVKIIEKLCDAIIEEQHTRCPPYTPPMDDRCMCGYDLHEMLKLSYREIIEEYKALRLPGNYLKRTATGCS